MLRENMRRQLRRAMRLHHNGYPDELAVRQQTLTRIRDCEEQGQVAVVVNGIDCDKMHYEFVYFISAVPMQVFRFLNQLYHDADGTFRYSVLSPAVARVVQDRRPSEQVVH